MRGPQGTKWLIYTRGDSYTNKVVASQLSAENVRTRVECRDQKTRVMWECSADKVKEFEASRADLNLKFKVYVQRNGAPAEVWRPTPEEAAALRAPVEPRTEVSATS